MARDSNSDLQRLFDEGLSEYFQGDYIACRSLMQDVLRAAGATSRLGVDAIRWSARAYVRDGRFLEAARLFGSVWSVALECGFDMGVYWQEYFDALCRSGQADVAAELAEVASCEITGPEALSHLDWIHTCIVNCKRLDATPFMKQVLRISAEQLGQREVVSRGEGGEFGICIQKLLHERERANRKLSGIHVSLESCAGSAERLAFLEEVLVAENCPLVRSIVRDAMVSLGGG